MAGPDLSRFITREELAGRLEPLAEIRKMLGEDIRELKTGQTTILTRMDTLQTDLADRASEALTEAEAAKIAAGSAAESAAAAQALAQEIFDNGCRRGDRHLAAVKTLAAAGVVPTNGVEAAPELAEAAAPRWARVNAKQVGAGAGIGATLMLLLPYLEKLVVWAGKYFTTRPTP